MLDVFLQAGYGKEKTAAHSREMTRLMMKLPNEELLKIASGDASCGPKEGSSDEWLEKFRGSPLLDQAFSLAQEEIALDMQDLQERQQRKEEDTSRGDHYMAKDQIGLKKRLLELQLVHGEVGGGGEVPGASPAAPEVGAQGAGAPGPEAMALEGGKTAAARADELVSFAVGLGRELAHQEFRKVARAHKLATVAPAGAALAKMAINWGGVGQMALGAVKKNPMAALGAGLGAVRGATARDARGERHPLSGALGGGVQGAFLGAGASKLVPGADAKITDLARQAAPHLQGLGEKLRGAVSSMPTG